MTPSFIHGGNTGLTYEQMKRRRALAEALMPQGAARNVGEGIAHIGQSIAAALMNRKADKAESAGRTEASKAFEALMGRYGGGSAPDVSGLAEAVSPSRPRGEAPDDPAGMVYAKLTEAGIPPHAAAGILGNIRQESGFRTDAVGDGGNSFGMGQWNGPRREALMAFAQERGADPSDIGVQTDFLLHELQTTEAPAFEAILAASTPEEAARVASEKFWRPGDPRMENRTRYATEAAMQFAGQQPQVPVQQAGGLDPVLLQALANPYLDGGQRAVVEALLQQQIQHNQPPDPITPYQQAQLAAEKERIRLAQEDNELARQRFEAETNRGGFRPATPEELERFGVPAGQIGPDNRFYPVNVPDGMAIESDGQGGIRIVQGPGVQTKPFTEGQSKDNVYYTRASGSLPTLDQYAEALANFSDKTMDLDPTGVVRGSLQSEEYQLARTAADEFLQAILRKDTGAAITQDETVLYGKTYLPQPGDGPRTLAYKKEARQRAVSAIEAGMSPAQMVAAERALAKQQGIDFTAAPEKPGEKRGATAERPSPDAMRQSYPGWEPPPGPAPEGVDESDWYYMLPEERGLFS